LIGLSVLNSTTHRVMLVTNQLQVAPAGGRELLCKLNYEALKVIFKDRLLLLELPSRPLQGIKSVMSAFGGHIDGLTDATIENALQTIGSERVGQVIVDGSNLGEFVKAVKGRHPTVEVITFFHNVEARFFLGSLRERRSLRALGVFVANYLAERKAVRYTDKLICLSERDSGLLQRVYGRPAKYVSPMALLDKRPAKFEQNAKAPPEKFALFVGGTFYANRAGIAWFVEHVVPRIQIKTCIVGRGFEELRNELERDGKVEVIGAVDQLADWYRDAQFVIAPIFDGSGMKTKVAEALMFGKKIIGTPEAFSGYEDIADRAGWVCSSADDFVAAIDRARDAVSMSFDPALRAIYEDKYSFMAAIARFEAILSATSKISLIKNK
jgi:polysaccharide biosynthesis protein PslH